MSRVSLNRPAPNFRLPDFSGKIFSLAEMRVQKNVLLVFNFTEMPRVNLGVALFSFMIGFVICQWLSVDV